MKIPADRRCSTRSRRNSVIDGQDGIRAPIGMSGVRLEANVHLVTGAAARRRTSSSASSAAASTVDELVPSAAGQRQGGADRRRARARRVPGRHRRRHHRHRDLHRRARSATPRRCRSAATRSPATSPWRAHADRGRRGDQDQVRLRADAGWRTPRKPSRCPASATARRAGSRARRWPERAGALRGDLRDGAGRAAPLAATRSWSRRRGADRRRREDGRRGGAGRGDLPQAGAHRRAAARRPASAKWSPTRARHRRGPAAARRARRRHARRPGRSAAASVAWSARLRGLVHREFLKRLWVTRSVSCRAKRDRPTTEGPAGAAIHRLQRQRNSTEDGNMAFEMIEKFAPKARHQGDRRRRRRRQRRRAHDQRAASRAWSSSAPTPTRRR